jgi:GNAT superfamily N-acetyltransferase
MKEAEAPYAVLEDLAVEPQARTQGLGTKILTEIEAEAKRRGCLWLFLESGRKNNAAHVFFERAGFNLISQVFMKRLPKKT